MLGQKTVSALLTLKPSGPHSFEDLLRELLPELTGQPYHLSSSGRQGGVDGVSATGSIGFEAKRYGEKELDIPGLQGQLGRVRRTRPEVELWLLITTGRLAAQDRQELADAATDNGIALLILAEGDLSVAFHPMAGLCAIRPERVREVLADPSWRDPKKDAAFALDEVRAELEEIAAAPEFASFRASLEKELREIPTWRIFVQRQNQRLKRAILEDPKVRLGTGFDRTEVIPRTVKADLDQWLAAAMFSHEPHLGAVLGERFDGKTWMVLDWLVDRLDSLDVPVFFLGSSKGDVSDSLNEILVKETEEALGSFQRHARALLERGRRLTAGRTPWCLLILDGLNEYRSPSQPWQRHLSDAFARVEAEYRPATALCTVRARTWPEIEIEVRRLAKDQVQTIMVGPFDEVEFGEALRQVGKTREDLSAMPDGAQALVRRPRFFQLVFKHRERLGAFDIITPDVLYWLDVSDKLRRDHGSVRWTEDKYQGVLLELARRSKDRHAVLSRGEVLDSLGTQMRSELDTALEDLFSEGVLERRGIKFAVCIEHLATGMGLFLLELLDESSVDQNVLRERLREILSPYNDDDTAVAWLRRASVFALLSEEVSAAVIDVLTDEWLRSRNRPPDDLEQVQALERLLLEPLLRLAPRSWARKTGDRRLQDLSTLIFAESLHTKKDLIQKFVRRWARSVPTWGSRHVERRQGIEDQVRLALQEEGLRRLGLRQEGDSGLLFLHDTVLYLESLSPGLLEPDDLLSIVAAHQIPRGIPLEGGGWILRRALSDVPHEWFEQWVQVAIQDHSPVFRQIVWRILDIAQRLDLLDFLGRVKEQADEGGRRSPRSASYEEVYDSVFGEEEAPIHFLRMARHSVVDPSLPLPRKERLAGSRREWLETFADARLDLDNQVTSEEHLFEDTIPAVAAWMPKDGADVVRRQMKALARRLEKGQYWWANTMRRHAVLAEDEAREHLLEAVRVETPNEDSEVAQAEVLQVLLPGMEPSACIDAILGHRLDVEWDGLYYLAACLDADGLILAASTALEGETTPRNRARLYTLLASLETAPRTEAQVKTFLKDLISNDHDLTLGACLAAAYVPPELVPEGVMKEAFAIQREVASKRYLHPQVDIPELTEEMWKFEILHARTDFQLFNIAFVGRLQGQASLLVVLEMLLRDRDAEVRARVTRLLGWLTGNESTLETLAERDESLWVRQIAEQSLQVRRNEGFARHWLERFLSPKLTREERWGAAQLFLEVADGGCQTWAHDIVLNAPSPRIRGEAVLLLREAEALFERSHPNDIRKRFLGSQVWDLERVCHPWRRRSGWRGVAPRS